MKILVTALTVAIAIFVGSLAARLAYDYMSMSATAAVLEKATQDFERKNRSRQHAARRQREQSSIGIDLKRRCDEFTAAYNDSRGVYALEQSNIACERYQRYLAGGRRARN
jgi:hypothetical protein